MRFGGIKFIRCSRLESARRGHAHASSKAPGLPLSLLYSTLRPERPLALVSAALHPKRGKLIRRIGELENWSGGRGSLLARVTQDAGVREIGWLINDMVSSNAL